MCPGGRQVGKVRCRRDSGPEAMETPAEQARAAGMKLAKKDVSLETAVEKLGRKMGRKLRAGPARVVMCGRRSALT
jgi:hypothetical protein